MIWKNSEKVLLEYQSQLGLIAIKFDRVYGPWVIAVPFTKEPINKLGRQLASPPPSLYLVHIFAPLFPIPIFSPPLLRRRVCESPRLLVGSAHRGGSCGARVLRAGRSVAGPGRRAPEGARGQPA